MKRSRFFSGLGFAVALISILVSGCGPKIYNDGTYKAASQGDKHGYAVAEVTVKRDKITAVKITEYTEKGDVKDHHVYSYPEAKKANEDMHTGETNWPEKYIEAVSFALEKAKKSPTIKTTYFDGTFFGRSKADESGYGVAWVTIKNDKITAVEVDDVTEKGEFKDWKTYTYTRALEAKTEMEKRFVAKNGPDVDTFTGATGSSTKWIEAVQNALQNARVK